MESVNYEISKPTGSVLESTYVKLEPIRKVLLQHEVIKSRSMIEITTSPLVGQVLAEIDEQKPESLFVGPIRQETFLKKIAAKDQSDSGWVSESHDGRNVRREFRNGLVLFPKIESANDDGIVLSQTEMVPFRGVDAKGGGATFSFLSTRPGISSRIPNHGGLLGDKSQAFIPQGRGEWWGGNDYQRRMGEYKLLAKLAARGARVDYPVAIAKMDDPDSPSKDLGIICRLYRTPFNFETIVDTDGRDVDRALYLVLDGISVWKNEGLVTSTDIQQLPVEISSISDLEALQKFYYLKGAEIAGRDLAIIHQEKSLGNRNPQNMGNDFSHRDVFDGNDIDIKANTVRNIKERFGDAKDNILKMVNKLWEPISKLNDINGDLSLIRNVMRRLNPQLANEMMSEVVETFLMNYLQQEKGLSKRQLGNLLLLGANMEMFTSLFDFDFKNRTGIAGLVFRGYGNAIKELEGNKNLKSIA